MTDDQYTPKHHIQKDGTELFEIDCSKIKLDVLLDRKQMLAASAFGLGALLLAACGGSSGGGATTASDTSGGGATSSDTSGGGATSSAGVGEGQTIAASFNGFNVYVQQEATGILKALAGTNYKFIGAQANFDAKIEISNIENLIVQQPDALLILPNVAAGANAGARKATAAGIATINLLWPEATGSSPDYIAVTRVDGVAGGKMMADYLGKDEGLKGQILVVTGVPGQGFSEEILKGLQEGLKSYPDLTIADVQPGFFQAGPAQEVLQQMLTATPDAVAVADFAAEMGVGIAQYLKQRDITNLKHITSDGNSQMIPWLKEGKYLTACRYYSSADQGQVGGMIARNYLETGAKPAEFITLTEQLLSLPSTIDADVAKLPLIYPEYMDQVKQIA